MKSPLLKIIIIAIIMVIILWILVFKTPMGGFFNSVGAGLETVNKDSLRLVGTIVFINFAVIFGILGYIVSGQKGKNRFKWTFLCILFNFWAFLFLTFLPSEKDK